MSTRIPSGRRATQPTRCPRCGAPTLTGLDNEGAALTATVEAVGLTRTGEILAVVAGWTTFEHDPAGALWRRDRWRLARAARNHVHPEHRCTLRIPDSWQAPTARARRVTNQTPPF